MSFSTATPIAELAILGRSSVQINSAEFHVALTMIGYSFRHLTSGVAIERFGFRAVCRSFSLGCHMVAPVGQQTLLGFGHSVSFDPHVIVETIYNREPPAAFLAKALELGDDYSRSTLVAFSIRAGRRKFHSEPRRCTPRNIAEC